MYTEQGELVGFLIVWVEDGYLSAFEYPWVTDEPPGTWPDPTQVRLTHVER